VQATETQRSRTRRDLFRGLYWPAVLNLACVALLNNNPWVAPSARVWLATLAALNELIGVVLIASPELGRHVPRLLRFLWHGLREAVRPLEIRARRLLRLPPPAKKVAIGTAEEISLANSLRVQTALREGATPQEAVDYLLREVMAARRTRAQARAGRS
jgi:hypothetical protein